MIIKDKPSAEEFMDACMRCNLWGAFVSRRKELTFVDGKPNKAADKVARKEFMDKLKAAPEPPKEMPKLENPLHVTPKPEEKTVDPTSPFVGKKAETVVVIQWVFDNMMNKDVKMQDAPNAGAWGYLNACRNDETVRSDFYKVVWPKTMPDKKDLAYANRFEDDGRHIQDIINRMFKDIDTV